MTELQNSFLGGNVAVSLQGEENFEKMKAWMAAKNLFLADKSPANLMKYPGDQTFVVYRHDDASVYWSNVVDVDQEKYKIVQFHAFFQETTENTESAEHEVLDPNDLQVSITQVTPAKIDSNIKALKDITIPKIKQYANTVVTEDNYKEIDTMLTGLRKARDTLNKGKVSIKKEASKTIIEFEEDVKDILSVFDDVINKLATQTEEFKNRIKEEKRKELQAQIEVLKTRLIENNMISKKYADQFEFDDKWLNKTTSKKVFRDGVEAQFEALIEKEKVDKENYNAIKAAVESQELPAGMMKLDTYLSLYDSCNELGTVIARINKDGQDIKKGMEEEKKKAADEATKKVIEEVKKEAPVIPVEEPVNSSLELHKDEKTGEVYAKSDTERLIVRMQHTPANISEDKIFKYTYEFEGNYAVIKTFSNILKVLSKINKTFKYKKI